MTQLSVKRVCIGNIVELNSSIVWSWVKYSTSRLIHKGSSLSVAAMPTVLGCCYITVHSAMAALQNGFCSYKLYIHKKTNIMQIMTKTKNY